MAKWGEGDPRWIVEERPDAKNPNNWHWSEKNATPWSKQRLKELFEGFVIETKDAKITLTELKECTGEATANNRKGKLIFLYEWPEFKVMWEGRLSGSNETKEGKVVVPNFSDEYLANEIDVDVTTKTTDDDSYKLKDILRKEGTKMIQEQIGKYIAELQTQFSQGLILPTPGVGGINVSTAASGAEKPKPASAPRIQPSESKSPPQKSESKPVKLSVKDLTLTESFKCTAEELFRVFVTPEMVQAFTNGGCQILEPKTDGRFKLWGGMAEGNFLKLEANKCLILQWRQQKWPSGHFSCVTLRFVERSDDTELQLEQTQIPDSFYEDTRNGWQRHYFEAIKRTFGFGALLL